MLRLLIQLCVLLATSALLSSCSTLSRDKFADCQFGPDRMTCASGIICEQVSKNSMLCTGGLRCDFRDESLYCTDGSVYGKSAATAYAAAPQYDFSRRPQTGNFDPLDLPPPRQTASCTLGAGGLLRCSNGVSCQASTGSALVRCSNGLSCTLDPSGLMRCNDGTSANRDTSGLTRFSGGTWSISNEGGVTKRSDGGYCITDRQFGLTRCYSGR